MTYILIFIIIVLAGLLVFRKTREPIIGICEVAMESDAKKKERLREILELLQGSETGEISNAEIRQELGMSERSVVRYMDELEREGKVEQIGATGRSVIYRAKT